MSKELSHFTLFPELPAEIRLKIWNFALPGPRIIEIFDLKFLHDFPKVNAIPPSARKELRMGRLSDDIRKSISERNNSTENGTSTSKESKELGFLDSTNDTNNVGSSTTLKTFTIEAADREEREEPNESGDLNYSETASNDAQANDDESDIDSCDFIPHSSSGSLFFEDSVRNWFSSSCDIPITLHVCRESRQETLRTYHLGITTISNNPSFASPRIYINFDIDTLFFPIWSWKGGVDSFLQETIVNLKDCSLVQRVAFGVDSWFSSEFEGDDINGQVNPRRWPSLKELTMTTTEPHPSGACSCCLGLERPQVLGQVGFVEPSEYFKNEDWNPMLLREAQMELDAMARQMGKDWKMPHLKLRGLTRDGVRTYL